MGLFDLIHVCPSCRKGVIPVNKGLCPECGTEVVDFDTDAGFFNPKEWNKKSAEEQKAHIDKALSKFETSKFITTTSSFEHYEIEEYLGPVSGTDIYLVGGVVGGGLANQETLFTSAFNNAKANMFSRATKLGANAVVGMQVNFTSPGNLNNMVVVVIGTAVKIKAK